MVVFFLGPLAGLLILRRPSSRRQWLWLATIAVWAAVWVAEPGGLADQSLRAGGILFTGAFIIAVVLGRGSLLSQTLWAAAGAVVATGVWCRYLGIGWWQIELALEAKGWESYRMVASQVTRGAPAGSAVAGALDQFAAGVGPAAMLTPALAVLMAVAGGTLAVHWHHRIAGKAAEGSRPFRAFTVSDFLVWAVIAGLGLYLADAGRPYTTLALNGLAVVAVLYGIRGAAVVWAIALERRGWQPLVLALVGGLLLFPFVAASLVLVGLADTWIGFRQRTKRLSTGGTP
ncbi:MAG TPA: DUF2232 domain-containing protein [Gemmatimonadales bacterium]|nr:DUF2232 domain-containing protein [Gemmatimonadales bacterium]